MPWKDPLLEALAKGTPETDNLPALMSREDRPRLNRPRMGWVGRVPEGAIDCTLGEIAETGLPLLHKRLGMSGTFRIAFNLNMFDWRPWGMLHGIHGGARRQDTKRPDYFRYGSVSVHRPGASMGASYILGGSEHDSMHTHRAWLWTLETERNEDLFLTRRRPRAAA